jgi:hypothetical protein
LSERHEAVALPRVRLRGSLAATLYFEDYRAAIRFNEKALGPPSYVEGENTRGCPSALGVEVLIIAPLSSR